MILSELFESKVGNRSVAMPKIISYIERKMGFKLRKLGVEEFKNSRDAGFGVRYVEDGTLNCIRFNWSGKNASEIVSVDLWNGTKHDPNFHIDFKGTSLAKSLPTLVAVLQKPTVGSHKVSETALSEERKDAVYDPELSDNATAGFTTDDGEQYYCKRSQLPDDHPNKKPGLNEAKKGEFDEASSIADMVKKLEAGRSFNRSEFVVAYHIENAHAYDEFVEKHKSDLTFQGKRISLPKGVKLGKSSGEITGGGGSGELVVSKGGSGEEYETQVPESHDRVSFSDSIEHLEGLATGLIRGSFNALFVAGRGGTGKTQTIEDVLEEHGLDDGAGYFKITGSASAVGIYEALYKNRKGIVLFDDCDGALESQDGRNIIKAATDTKKIRKIAWGKKSAGMRDPDDEPDTKTDAEGEDIEDSRTPRYFNFEGRVIFISNLSLNKLDPDGALRTRAFVINIDPTPEEMFQRMEEILDHVKLESGTMSSKERMKVMEVVKTSRRAKDASLRTIVRALNLASSGAPNWEKLVQLYA